MQRASELRTSCAGTTRVPSVEKFAAGGGVPGTWQSPGLGVGVGMG